MPNRDICAKIKIFNWHSSCMSHESTMTVTIMLELRTFDEQTGTVSVPFRD